MKEMKQLTKLEELVGKTIVGVNKDDFLYLIFADDSFVKIIDDGYEETDIDLDDTLIRTDIHPHTVRELYLCGAITKVEELELYEKFRVEREERDKKLTQEKELKEFKRLQEKYKNYDN